MAFYSAIEGCLARAFPVLRRITPKSRWHSMIRDFHARHRRLETRIYPLAQQFLHYLDEERGARTGDALFLCELAHYEWVELELRAAGPVITPDLAQPEGDLMTGIPVVSPLAWTLTYEYPVHRIRPDYLPESTSGGPHYLIVYRGRRGGVRFMQINAATARLKYLMEREPDSGQAQLRRLAGEIHYISAEELLHCGEILLKRLRDRGILLGTRRRCLSLICSTARSQI